MTRIAFTLSLLTVVVSMSVASGAQQLRAPAQVVHVNNTGKAEALPVSVKDEAVPVKVAGEPLPIEIAKVEKAVPVSDVRKIWEYSEISYAFGESPLRALATAGAQGWEATGATYTVNGKLVMLLKRYVVEEKDK